MGKSLKGNRAAKFGGKGNSRNAWGEEKPVILSRKKAEKLLERELMIEEWAEKADMLATHVGALRLMVTRFDVEIDKGTEPLFAFARAVDHKDESLYGMGTHSRNMLRFNPQEPEQWKYNVLDFADKLYERERAMRRDIQRRMSLIS